MLDFNLKLNPNISMEDDFAFESTVEEKYYPFDLIARQYWYNGNAEFDDLFIICFGNAVKKLLSLIRVLNSLACRLEDMLVKFEMCNTIRDEFAINRNFLRGMINELKANVLPELELIMSHGRTMKEEKNWTRN